MSNEAIGISGHVVSPLARIWGMAWGWQRETRTVANVSANVSISISISNGDEWRGWQQGLVCPQPETGGPLSRASGYWDEPQCASLLTNTHTNTHRDPKSFILSSFWYPQMDLSVIILPTAAWSEHTSHFHILKPQTHHTLPFIFRVQTRTTLHVLQSFVTLKYVEEVCFSSRGGT